MDSQTLQSENLAFSGTRGVSAHAAPAFRPAFLDKQSGRIELARHTDGRQANCHLIGGLPLEWATRFDQHGAVAAVRSGIIAGFVSEGVFYTRDQVAEL